MIQGQELAHMKLGADMITTSVGCAGADSLYVPLC